MIETTSAPPAPRLRPSVQPLSAPLSSHDEPLPDIASYLPKRQGPAICNRVVLAKRIGRQLGIPLAEAQECVDAMIDALTQAIGAGEAIVIRDFGTIAPVWRAERIARNPAKVEEEVVIPAHNHVKFKPAPRVKDLLRKLPKFPHYLNSKPAE